jgi:hypothetical protein
MIDYEELAAIDFLPEMRETALANKAEVLQSFCREAFFAPSGLAYSMPLIRGPREARPLTNTDLVGTASYANDEYGQDDDLARAIAEEGCTFENSLCTAGLYLQAQAWRYRATGDPGALREARRGFQGIQLVHEMNAAVGRPGFLSKPYGERATLTSTADQYLFALAGLYRFRNIASDEEAALIDRIFVDCASFAMTRGYDFTFLKSDWYLDCEWNVALKEHDYLATMQSEQHAYNAIHMLLQALAWRASGNARHWDELARLREHGRWMTETYLEPWRRQGIGRLLLFERVGLSYFPIAAGEILFEIAPELFGATVAEQTSTWQAAALRWWEFGKLGMDEELRSHYWIDIDVPSGTWRSTGYHVKEGLQPNCIDDFCSGAYLSEVRESEVAYRQGYNSLAIALACPSAETARSLAFEMLRVTDGARLRWMFDPDGRQLLPPFRYMTTLLSSESPGHFLIMYWKGRVHGLWD